MQNDFNNPVSRKKAMEKAVKEANEDQKNMMLSPDKREEIMQEEFYSQSSNTWGDAKPKSCPSCKTTYTEPNPGCRCRAEAGMHIMKYHHSCN